MTSDNTVNFTFQDSSTMSDNELKNYRKSLSIFKERFSQELSGTSKKELSVSAQEAKEYIDKILEDGYNLTPTKLSSTITFLDCQHILRFKDIIKDCVQQSKFSTKQFKIKELARQRSAIEKSKTLHLLRQNVAAMIGPLSMYREFSKPEDAIEYKLTTEDELIVEVEDLTLLLNERNRMLSEIMHLYNQPFEPEKLKGSALLEAVEDFKVQHNCTDEAACKVFNVSRSTLARLRKESL